MFLNPRLGRYNVLRAETGFNPVLEPGCGGTLHPVPRAWYLGPRTSRLFSIRRQANYV